MVAGACAVAGNGRTISNRLREGWNNAASGYCDDEAAVDRLCSEHHRGPAAGIAHGAVQVRRGHAGRVGAGLQTLPSVCWIPLALLWYGQTEGAMLFVVIMGSLWSILIATDNGVRTVPPIYARAARTMGSRQLHTWIKVILPASLPFIVSGMKQGWAFAWRAL